MAFATPADVKRRLGRDLNEAEAGIVDFLLEAATAGITAAVGKTDEWADALNPVPRIVKIVTVELVMRAKANPDGVVSMREQLGSYAVSQQYRAAAETMDILPTRSEELLLRQAVFGRTSGSVKTESVATELYDIFVGGS
jgi:hypothetical protein